MTLTYIFHSGFEMEETFNPIAHEKQFLGELKDIRKVADSFDVVMFPIDGRVGNGYTTAIPLVADNSSSGSKSDCSSLCTSLQALNPLGV